VQELKRNTHALSCKLLIAIFVLTFAFSSCGQVVKIGNMIATINVNLTSMKTGALVAQGKHIKFLTSRDKGIPQAPLARARSRL